ncbi:MAG: signal peptidase I [Candidatus Hydrogenedentes bacterium]|nr:signal peptidase I [Candidatus Hydrogenedentota bacterium]
MTDPVNAITPDVPPETSPKEKVRQELRHDLWRFVKLVVLLLVAVVLCRTFVVETWPIQGPSMYPTLHENDRILVFKLPLLLSRLPFLQWLDPVEPGDLIVFETNVVQGRRVPAASDAEAQKLIKRVIAEGPAGATREVVQAGALREAATSPYDVHVLYDHGAVYVNNHRLVEPYLTPQEQQSPDFNEARLKAGQYYVLGDHRSVSKDSRFLGPIPREQVIGEAVFCLWPLHRMGRLG